MAGDTGQLAMTQVEDHLPPSPGASEALLI